MFDVVAIGEMLIDFTCDSLQADGYPTLDAHPGGGILNFLAPLSKYGMLTSVIGKLGKDSFGKLLADTVVKCGINGSSISVTKDAFTTLAFVNRDLNGEREFSFARKPGADTLLTEDDVDFELIDKSKVLHFSSVCMTNEPSKSTHMKVVEYAKSKNKIISYDPNYREALWESEVVAKETILWGLSKSDVVKISDEEIAFLFETFPENGAKILLDEYNVKLVFVTLGKDGCYFANKNAHGYIPVDFEVEPIDTTGAGDIFGGSAMYGILKTRKLPDQLGFEELERIVKFAIKTASLSTEKLGGVSSLPPMQDF